MKPTLMAFENEASSNSYRQIIAELEPQGLRTYTPTLAVLARSEGIYHWTPEGRRLYDYTSGVLVANLGHNPRAWLERFWGYLGWSGSQGSEVRGRGSGDVAIKDFALGTPHSGLRTQDSALRTQDSGLSTGFVSAVPLTAYNATTPIEAEACRRLVANLQSKRGGSRLEQVMWAASGSEAIQKALWACLHHGDHIPSGGSKRDIILATRRGFHGKKGLAGACTGDETSPERDPRVRFLSFPIEESKDVTLRGRPFDPAPYERELNALKTEFGKRRCCLITEPYLGGAGSYHPPAEYLQLLQRFCRENDLIFILDEVQSNFGRTGNMYAFETYGVEPDIVVLGKGLGNGVPVAAAVGRADVLGSLDYGEGSDTYSAHPMCCAAVLATLDLFESGAWALRGAAAGEGGGTILAHTRKVSRVFGEGLLALKEIPLVTHLRGEGLVWGVEVGPFAGCSAGDVANACVRACYLGDGEGNAIHLMGPLAGNVLRIGPPLVISEQEARASLRVLYAILRSLADELAGSAAGRALAPTV